MSILEDKLVILKSKLKSLKARRAPWEDNWQNVSNYVNPNRGDFSATISKGGSRTRLIYDGTAPWALDQFASGLSGFLTSATERWFDLKTADPELMTNPAVRSWLEESTNIMYDSVFNSADTDFTSQNHELYLDLGSFGTAVMLIEDPPGAPQKFRTFHLNNCYLAENARGMVDTLYRRYTQTGRQLLDLYSDKLTTAIKDKITKNPYADYEVWHIVEPNDRFLKDSILAINKPWSSIFVMFEPSGIILEESGFDEFPYVVPRWKRTAEEWYGRSPAMNAMPDIMMLNSMMKTVIKAAQLGTAPPMQGPDDGFMAPLRLGPFGMNYYRAGSTDRIEPIKFNPRADIGLDLVRDRTEKVLKNFFVDLTRAAQSNVEKTRAEVLIEQEDKMRNIAPMAGRLEVEHLTRTIRRTFNIQLRRGTIAPPPVALTSGLSIIYSSPVKRAQKATQLASVSRWLETVIPLLDIKPELIDFFDGDEYLKWSHGLLDAPEKVLRSNIDVEQLRADRAEQQQSQQQQEQLNTASQTGVNAAKASELLSRGQ